MSDKYFEKLEKIWKMEKNGRPYIKQCDYKNCCTEEGSTYVCEGNERCYVKHYGADGWSTDEPAPPNYDYIQHKCIHNCQLTGKCGVCDTPMPIWINGSCSRECYHKELEDQINEKPRGEMIIEYTGPDGVPFSGTMSEIKKYKLSKKEEWDILKPTEEKIKETKEKVCNYKDSSEGTNEKTYEETESNASDNYSDDDTMTSTDDTYDPQEDDLPKTMQRNIENFKSSIENKEKIHVLKDFAKMIADVLHDYDAENITYKCVRCNSIIPPRSRYDDKSYPYIKNPRNDFCTSCYAATRIIFYNCGFKNNDESKLHSFLDMVAYFHRT